MGEWSNIRRPTPPPRSRSGADNDAMMAGLTNKTLLALRSAQVQTFSCRRRRTPQRSAVRGYLAAGALFCRFNCGHLVAFVPHDGIGAAVHPDRTDYLGPGPGYDPG